MFSRSNGSEELEDVKDDQRVKKVDPDAIQQHRGKRTPQTLRMSLSKKAARDQDSIDIKTGYLGEG